MASKVLTESQSNGVRQMRSPCIQVLLQNESQLKFSWLASNPRICERRVLGQHISFAKNTIGLVERTAVVGDEDQIVSAPTTFDVTVCA